MKSKSIGWGWVYVITNPSFRSNQVKIGYTLKYPDVRAKELHSTGTPLGYQVEYQVICFNPKEVESLVHEVLADTRISPDREWFACNRIKAVQAIKKVLGEKIFYEKSERNYSNYFPLDYAEIGELAVSDVDKITKITSLLNSRDISFVKETERGDSVHPNLEFLDAALRIRKVLEQLKTWAKYNSIVSKIEFIEPLEKIANLQITNRQLLVSSDDFSPNIINTVRWELINFYKSNIDFSKLENVLEICLSNKEQIGFEWMFIQNSVWLNCKRNNLQIAREILIKFLDSIAHLDDNLGGDQYTTKNMILDDIEGLLFPEFPALASGLNLSKYK